MKIVVNKQPGGKFGLSDKARMVMGHCWKTDNGIRAGHWVPHATAIERDDLALVDVVERVGAEANGRNATLAVVEIRDDVAWRIICTDGVECVIEEPELWVS